MMLVFWPGIGFKFDYDTGTLLEDDEPRRGLKHKRYSYIPEQFEIFHTFLKRYNVDMGILHEEADGPWMPAGELEYDWVGNLVKLG